MSRKRVSAGEARRIQSMLYKMQIGSRPPEPESNDVIIISPTVVQVFGTNYKTFAENGDLSYACNEARRARVFINRGFPTQTETRGLDK